MDWAGPRWFGDGVWVIIDGPCLEFFYLDSVVEIRNPCPAQIFKYNCRRGCSDEGTQTHDLPYRVI